MSDSSNSCRVSALRQERPTETGTETSEHAPARVRKQVRSLGKVLLLHALLWVIACAMFWFAWTGFISSDDEYYVSSGLGWLHDFPFVARNFGEIRAGVGIPMAVMIGLFGESELTVVSSTALFFLATLSLTLEMLSRVLPPAPAFVASAGMVAIPLFAVSATIPNADLPELFFVVSSFWMFWLATQRERRGYLLILSGVSAALAFSAHEVSVALVLFYGILFMVGYGMPRRMYWIMAIGFLAVLLGEALYYLLATGDPLYRFELSVKGAGVRDRTEVGFLQFSRSGTLHVWEPIDPLIMLFTHQHQFSLLGFFTLPALWWTFFGPKPPSVEAGFTVRLLAGLGTVWLVFSALALTNQQLLPRYYTVSAYCFYLTAAMWFVLALWPRYPKSVIGLAFASVLVGLIGIYVSNSNPRFGERTLVRYLSETHGLVYTDPMTAEKSHWYCRWAKLDCGRIVAGPPPPGGIYFYNPKNADHANRLMKPDEVALYQPKPDWQLLWRVEEPRKWPSAALENISAFDLVPERISRRLSQPNAPVVLYQAVSNS
jgi:4-amino-4-deoxy-L-arabinose transferase-like glycosyltransferase